MRRRIVVGLSLAAALVNPGRLLAHEGHAHKVMGTVAAVDAKHIEVDAKDGKKVSIELTAETKYLKPSAVTGGAAQAASAADMKVGQRVVVTVAEAGEKKTAKEVMLGAVEKAAEKAHPHETHQH